MTDLNHVAPHPQKALLDAFDAAWNLIKHPADWIQGMNATTREGAHIPYYHREAECFCSHGALRRVVKYTSVHDQKIRAAFAKAMGFSPITTFNDNHTHEEVMAAWAAARELLEKDLV